MGKNNELEKTKNDTLFLIQTNKNDFAYLEWEKNNINSEIIMKEFPKYIRAIRRLWFYLDLPFKSFWYSPNWKKNINNYKNFIIHASSITMKVPEYIYKRNPKAKIILWYWNPVDKKTRPTKIKLKNIEKWTFDLNDAKKYNLNYNTQYYFASKSINKNKKIKNDVFFIGLDKGRGIYVKKIYDLLKKKGLKLDFNLVTKEKNNYNEEMISNFLSYDTILERISESKSILEIVQKNQSGPTLRTLESLFFSKKLITNNKNLKNYDFYNENNIIIIDIENIDKYINEIISFLEKPYRKIDENIINYYEFNNWLMRFFKEDQLQ